MTTHPPTQCPTPDEPCPPTARSLCRTTASLQLISDLGRIATLVCALARHLVENEVPASVREVVGSDLVIVERAGAERLRTLARGLPVPDMEAHYVRCGCELRRVRDRLTSGQRYDVQEPVPGRIGAVSAGAGLAEAILMASRHAGRAKPACVTRRSTRTAARRSWVRSASRSLDLPVTEATNEQF